MNKEKRDLLISDYVTEVLDDMDIHCLLNLAETYMKQNLADYSDEQLITEVKDHYPQLLED